jgi:hypothetical protein
VQATALKSLSKAFFSDAEAGQGLAVPETAFTVIPAKAGIQSLQASARPIWIPAFAGMRSACERSGITVPA